MLSANFKRKKLPYGYRVTHVDGRKVPHLDKLRIPPAWTQVQVDPNPRATVLAVGYDEAGRKQRLYSPDHIANAKSSKFERVRGLLTEWEDIRTQIEGDLNDKHAHPKDRECALMALLIYETGIRPGGVKSARGDASQEGTATFGASTLQLRHVKPCDRGVRLKFVGKKGVDQNILVTHPHLVREFKRRKKASTAWSTPLFEYSVSSLHVYFDRLGSGIFTPKDFRTARGTSLALELLGHRKRVPKAKSKQRKVVNDALDKVAKMLGNTRAVSRNSYVDPNILSRFLPSLPAGAGGR